MTQPTQAVGGDGNPADANPATPFEDIAAEMLGEDKEEEQPAEADEDEAPEVEAEAVEEAEDDVELEADDLPPIDAPHSWSAEEKAAFADMPRHLQETVQRREAEREKFVQSKAQEAAQKEKAAMRQAAEFANELRGEAIQQLEQYAQMLAVPEPDPALITADPVAYQQQVQAHRYWTAQRQAAQQQADTARQEQAHIQAALQQHESESFHQRLSTEIPEFFDATEGPKLKEQLTATAQALGFTEDDIFSANASQIIALKKITDLQAKADKYDRLMAKQMERVRQGKAPPPISKPGTARTPDQTSKARANAAWETAKSAKSRNAKDDAIATWMENTGWM